MDKKIFQQGKILLLIATTFCVSFAAQINFPLELDGGRDFDEIDLPEFPYWYGIPVKVNNIVDNRPEEFKNFIGQRKEDDGEKHQVFTDSDIPNWGSNVLRYLLEYIGFMVVSEDFKYSIDIKLNNFFVNEESFYDGNINTTIILRDQTGNIICEEEVIGTSRWWGDTFEKLEYIKAIGNVWFDLVSTFIENEEIMHTFSGIISLNKKSDLETDDILKTKMEPPSSKVLPIVLGGILAGVGISSLIVSAQDNFSNTDDSNQNTTIFSVALVAGGSLSVGIGFANRVNYKNWQKEFHRRSK